MTEYLQNFYGSGRMVEFIVSAEILFGTLAVLWLIRIPFRRRLLACPKTALWPKLLEVASRPLFQSAQALAIFAALEHLAVRHATHRLLHIYAAAVVTIGAARLVIAVVRFTLVDHWAHPHSDRRAVNRQWRSLMPVVSIAVWLVGMVCFLDNLGVNISTLVAGLGIGGVAIALASQGFLADLFAYFAILFDRPFDIDDFIVMDQFMGTVEYIGIKTTRLRSLSGEQLVLANSDVTKTRLRNYRRMQQRRVEFVLTVDYGNAVEKLRQMPAWVGEIVARHELVQFDFARVTSLAGTGVTLSVAYFVHSDDYAKHLEIQEDILLAIKSIFDENGLRMAMPTQRLMSPLQLDVLPIVPGAPARKIISGDFAA